MIYVNDELIDLKGNPEFEAIKKMSNPIRIREIRRAEINPTGIREAIPTCFWPLRNTIIREGQTETWQYTKNKPTVKDGQLVFKKNSVQIDFGDLAIDAIRETDFAYFMIYISDILKHGYEIVDYNKKAAKEVEAVSERSTLDFFCTSAHSPLVKDEQKLRYVAASWGIPNSSVTDINILKLELRDKVVESNNNITVTGRGIQDFIEEVETENPITNYRALIQRAVDAKVIGFNFKQSAWFFIDKHTGENTDYILPVMSNEVSQKDRLLLDYLCRMPDIINKLESMLGTGSKYAKYKWPGEFRALCSERGIDTKNKTRLQLEKELTEQDKVLV